MIADGSPNEQNDQIFNTDIAGAYTATTDSILVMAVFEYRNFTTQSSVIGFSRGDNPIQSFTEGTITTNANSNFAQQYGVTATDFAEPTVVWGGDTLNNDFLCVAVATLPAAGNIPERRTIVANYFNGTSLTWGQWWEVPNSALSQPLSETRRPVIVRGEVNEFYVFWTRGGSGLYSYAHATSPASQYASASFWTVGNTIIDSITGLPITGTYAIFPSVFDDEDVYLAYMPDANTIGFLKGVDNSSGGGMTFSKLISAYTNAPLTVTLAAASYPALASALPGNETTYTPQIAVDPTNPSRLYLAYHDLHGPGSTDVNVYLRTIDRRGLTKWVIGPSVVPHGMIPIPPECSPDTDTDQYLAGMTVDRDGIVHTTYYDDRESCQTDSVTTTAKYGVSYGFSCDSGQTFETTHYESPGGLDVAYADFELESASPAWSMHEYIGLDVLTTPTSIPQTFALLVLTGTDADDQDVGNESCIYYRFLIFN